MKQAIMNNAYGAFVNAFLQKQFKDQPVPEWVVDALDAAGIKVL